VVQGRMLPPVASASLRSVAQSFGESWHQRKRAVMINSANATHHLRALSNEALALSMVAQASMSERLSPAEQVQQRVFHYVTNANKVMRSKLRALDLYRQSAVYSKHLQHVLIKKAVRPAASTPLAKHQELYDQDLPREPLNKNQKQQDQDQSIKVFTLLQRLETNINELKEQATINEEVWSQEREVSTALEQMDSLWWQLSLQFDHYLDAADGQVKGFKAALKALHAYTLECSANFADIKDAFATSARAESQTRAVLKEVWTAVLPVVGVLTAKIEDSAYLLLFAQADVRAVDIVEQSGLNTSAGRELFCREREKQQAVAEEVVRTAMKKGIYGQALSQLKVMLGHLVMLQDRYVFAGLGKAPSAEALTDAAKRLQVAKESVDTAIPALGERLVKQVACVVMK